MVMEASPSPQSVGREFVRQYYTLLNKAPAHLHRFYNNYSSFVHGGLDAPNRETLPVVGQKQIHNRIQQLNFRDCHAKISQVDAQATLGNGVVVQVTGELSNDGAPMRRFTQTFVLAAQSPKKYYVHNDIFRYQDIVFSDEEGEGSGRSEGEEEGVGVGAGGAGYYPGSFPGGFPAPPPAPPALLAPPSPPAPAAPSAPAPSAPAAPAPTQHLNGHPQHHEESVRHVASTLHVAPGLVPCVEAESAAPLPPAPVPPAPEELSPPPPPVPEPEPEREPEPPVQPVVQAPPEPKTYANLLKSGGTLRVSPPVVPAPAPAPAPAPPVSAPAPVPPQEQRARPPRAAPSQGGGEGRERESREREMREPREVREVREVREPRPPRYSDAQQLFLGNLPHSATEDELRALFARFGPVAELRVHTKGALPGAPRHPNYGFITYESSAHAHDCLAAAPLYFPPDSADGVKLNVEEKKARGREGGGGGGPGGAGGRRRPLSGQRGAPPFPRPPHRR